MTQLEQRYTSLQWVHEDQFGVYYKAVDLSDHEVVLIKILNAHSSQQARQKWGILQGLLKAHVRYEKYVDTPGCSVLPILALVDYQSEGIVWVSPVMALSGARSFREVFLSNLECFHHFKDWVAYLMPLVEYLRQRHLEGRFHGSLDLDHIWVTPTHHFVLLGFGFECLIKTETAGFGVESDYAGLARLLNLCVQKSYYSPAARSFLNAWLEDPKGFCKKYDLKQCLLQLQKRNGYALTLWQYVLVAGISVLGLGTLADPYLISSIGQHAQNIRESSQSIAYRWRAHWSSTVAQARASVMRSVTPTLPLDTLVQVVDAGEQKNKNNHHWVCEKGDSGQAAGQCYDRLQNGRSAPQMIAFDDTRWISIKPISIGDYQQYCLSSQKIHSTNSLNPVCQTLEAHKERIDLDAPITGLTSGDITDYIVWLKNETNAHYTLLGDTHWIRLFREIKGFSCLPEQSGKKGLWYDVSHRMYWPIYLAREWVQVGEGRFAFRGPVVQRGRGTCRLPLVLATHNEAGEEDDEGTEEPQNAVFRLVRWVEVGGAQF